MVAMRDSALPHGELTALRRPIRRTMALRVTLGLALAAVFLAAFADVAYELVPPGTPGRDLAPLIRFFAEGTTANPWASFQTGTNLSGGLEAARAALERDGVERGAILLASDLEFFPDDVPRLTATLGEMRADGTALRILPLGARKEQRQFFERVVGPGIFVEPAEAAAAASAGEAEGRFRLAEEDTPWLFACLVLVLGLLLAANERACGRLRLPPPEGAA